MKVSNWDADIGLWMKKKSPSNCRLYLLEEAEKGSGKAHTYLWEGDAALRCVLSPSKKWWQKYYRRKEDREHSREWEWESETRHLPNVPGICRRWADAQDRKEGRPQSLLLVQLSSWAPVGGERTWEGQDTLASSPLQKQLWPFLGVEVGGYMSLVSEWGWNAAGLKNSRELEQLL